jgi:UDP-3-O-[3-hydroxymyristoyl] glucosamine N-acyltransferase
MGTCLEELIGRLGGSLVGDPQAGVSSIASLERAGASDLSFLASARWRAAALASEAGAIILSPLDDAVVGAGLRGARIVTGNPHAYFAHAAHYLLARHAPERQLGIAPSAAVHASARIDPAACIGPLVTVEAGAVVAAGAVIDAGCFIGRDAIVGEGTHFFANVTFHARCIIGKRGIVHSGAVIGGDGFGFAHEDGHYVKVPQVGRVVLGDDVDIGSNTTVDRGALDDTVIGAHTAMAGCTGVAGSAKIGSHCTFGGASMINGHIEIVDNVHVTAGTLVPNSLLEPGRYTGFYPVAKNAEWKRNAVLLRNLTAMRERIRALEKAVKALGLTV